MANLVFCLSIVTTVCGWMSRLDDSLLIRDIPIIPGSHNSGTAIGRCAVLRYSIYQVARQQKLSITNQLVAGVRFLDIRIRYNTVTSQMEVVHTLDTSYSLESVLGEVGNFLASEREDFVVLMLRGDWPPTTSFSPNDELKAKRVGELVDLLKGSRIHWADRVGMESTVGSVRGQAVFVSDWFQYGIDGSDLLRSLDMPYLDKSYMYSVCDIWDDNCNEVPSQKISRFMMSSPDWNVGRFMGLFDRLSGGSTKPRICGSLPGSTLFTGVALDRTHAFIVPPGLTSNIWNTWFISNLKNNPHWRPQMNPPVPIGVVLIDFADDDIVAELIEVGLGMLPSRDSTEDI